MEEYDRRGSPDDEPPSAKRRQISPSTQHSLGGVLSPKTTPPQPPRTGLFARSANRFAKLQREEDDEDGRSCQMTVHDVLHGPIHFNEPIVKKIIDSKPFQRLRDLKQLGCAYFVYPGATHTNLRTEQPGLGITHKDILCVKIAGLCHDLGHGPFSHLFEAFLRRVAANMDDSNPVKQALKDWSHEAMSCKLVDYIFEQIHEKGINYSTPEYGGLQGEDLEFIKELILGAPVDSKSRAYLRRSKGGDKAFLYDIVNNLDTGFDVDKMDYLQRDAQHALGEISKSIDRLTSLARVCQVQCPENERQVYHSVDKEGFRRTISLPKKTVDDAMQMFGERMHMHNVVYQHRVVMTHDEAIIRILVLANDAVRIPVAPNASVKPSIAESALDVCAFMNLNDGILTAINIYPEEIIPDKGARARLLQAKDALMRIRRVVGHFVDGVKVEEGSAAERLFDQKGNEREIAEEIVGCADVVPSSQDESADEDALTSDDVIVLKRHIHYGARAKNPLDKMYFFTKKDCEDGDMRAGNCIASQVDCLQCCHNLPRSFEFKELYVLCEVGRDSPKWHVLQGALQHWCRDHAGAVALNIHTSQE